MDGPRYYTKWSQSEKRKTNTNDITYMLNLKYDTYITYMLNLKYDTNKHIYDRHREQTCGCQGGVEEGCSGSLGLTDANYYI